MEWNRREAAWARGEICFSVKAKICSVKIRIGLFFFFFSPHKLKYRVWSAESKLWTPYFTSGQAAKQTDFPQSIEEDEFVIQMLTFKTAVTRKKRKERWMRTSINQRGASRLNILQPNETTCIMYNYGRDTACALTNYGRGRGELVWPRLKWGSVIR